MGRSKLVSLVLLGLGPLAHADKFLCRGTGRFAAIENSTVELQWREPAQKVLMDGRDLKVLASIDKANADGSHYLAIEVLEMKDNAVSALRGAKGSLKDMVQYVDGEASGVTCVPVKE